MELYEITPPDLAALRQRGDARYILRSRTPRTLEEIVRDASDDMDAQDEAEERARDPLLWAWKHRPRRLIDVLLGRR